MSGGNSENKGKKKGGGGKAKDTRVMIYVTRNTEIPDNKKPVAAHRLFFVQN